MNLLTKTQCVIKILKKLIYLQTQYLYGFSGMYSFDNSLSLAALNLIRSTVLLATTVELPLKIMSKCARNPHS